MLKKLIVIFITSSVSFFTEATEINLSCAYDHLKGTDKDKPFSILINPELKQGAIKTISGDLHTDGVSYWFTINKAPGSVVDFREQYQIDRKNLTFLVKISAMKQSFTGKCKIMKETDNKI